MTIRVADFAAKSDVGRVRRANEDAYYVRSPLFVVADGMGGAQAGEVASKIATDAFASGLDESLAPETRMAAVVKAANLEIHTQSNTDASKQGMGTTLSAVLLGDQELTVAHVGDSRAYRLREGELTQLTRDHSLVGEMVRRGAITPAEAEVHPQRSILTRALGPEPDVEVDTLSYPVKPGDIYLLSSDGLTGMVDDRQIAEVAGSGKSMSDIADELIRRANDAGGVDNITVVAFKVGQVGEATATTDQPSDQSSDQTSDQPVTEIGSDTIVGAAAVVAGDGVELKTPDAAGVGPQTAAGGGNGHVSTDDRSARAASRRRAQTRRPRLWLGVGFAVLVLFLAAGGALVASLNIYFLGVDEHGLVTMYRGLPYEGPLEVKMYTKDYVSTVPASDLTAPQRAGILDHTLRTRGDAEDLITQIERGQTSTGGP
ncbi:MAG: Stp1/IreP family PP2C-type Ser/Thr phosphatase [Solirubrobacterales bacterium]